MGHAIMYNGAVGASAGDGVKAQIFQLAGSLTKCFSLFGGVDFSEFSGARMGVKPVQKLAKSRAVDFMGGDGTIDFRLCFASLCQTARVFHTNNLGIF